MPDGKILEGRWVNGDLFGDVKIVKPDGSTETARYLNGAPLTESTAKKTHSWLTFEVMSPMTLSLFTAGLGVGSLIQQDPEVKNTMRTAAGVFYGLSVLEAFTSNTWSYLWNIETQEGAMKQLDEFSKAEPRLFLSIKNYHMERYRKDHGRREDNKRKHANDDMDEYKNDKKINKKMKDIKKESDIVEAIERAQMYIKKRLRNKGLNDDIDRFKQLDDKQTKKDKKKGTAEAPLWVTEKIVSKEQTSRFEVKDFIDVSDPSSLLKIHSDIPVLRLKM
jgi:hypothetical protein